jgi:uncharacterized protein
MTMSSTSGLSATHNNVELAPLGLLVVQPTTFCNIDCSYCYLSHRSENNRMDGSTVKAIARFLRGMHLRDPQLSVVWHAGEPLTAPIDFYEATFQVLQSDAAPTVFCHHFQTNGMLISDAWCELFKRWSIQIGISIDGPKEIHDVHRVDRSNRGTYDRVMRGIAKLREHEIPFSVIGVLTRDALRAPAEFWRFFETLGATQVAFNVEEAEGINASSSLSVSGSEELFRAFLQRVAKLRSARPGIRLREFDGMRAHLMSPPGSEVMRADNMPGAIINIDLAGNVTTFSPELLGHEHARYGKFHWGNVHTDDWSAIVSHPGFRKAYSDILAGIELCRGSCGYFSVCGGGNPSNKLAELGTFVGAETQYCRLHVQAFADIVIEDLEHEIGIG